MLIYILLKHKRQIIYLILFSLNFFTLNSQSESDQSINLLKQIFKISKINQIIWNLVSLSYSKIGNENILLEWDSSEDLKNYIRHEVSYTNDDWLTKKVIRKLKIIFKYEKIAKNWKNFVF